MVTAEREIMLNLTTQHKLSVLQGLIVERSVQFCSLCRGVDVFVLNGNAVDGKSGSILELSFRPVGVHVVAAGKHFLRVIMVEILISFHLNCSLNDFWI